MNKPTLIQTLRPKSYVTSGFILLLILYVGYITIREILPYFRFTEESYGEYWDYKYPLFFHISCGIVAMLTGPFQFWKTLRTSYIHVHRWTGRVYLAAIFFGSLSATNLAWTSGMTVSFSWAFGLQALAFAWISTTFMAYYFIRKKQIIQHKEWMIRSYVVTLGFFFFRILNHWEFAKEIMPTFEERGLTIIWLCWAIPLLVTEIVLSLRK